MDLRYDDHDNIISDCITRALYISPHNHTKEIDNLHKNIAEHLSKQLDKQHLMNHLKKQAIGGRMFHQDKVLNNKRLSRMANQGDIELTQTKVNDSSSDHE